MTAAIATFTVPALNLDTLNKRLSKLSRKARKYGTAPIGYSIGETFKDKTTIYIDNEPKKITTQFVNITVWGEAPKYGNHTFLARVELREGENIVNNIANAELNPRFRHMVSECDHCGHNRIRNDVYVFANENGEQIAVGKTCLRDFTGCDNPLEITNRAQFLSEIKTHIDEDYDSFMSGFGSNHYSIHSVLETAAANIREYGWVSKSMQMNSHDENTLSTADMVGMDLNPNPKHKPVEIVNADKELANETIEYFRNMEPQNNNDYINNLRVILGNDVIIAKHIGLAVSSVNVILRNKQKETESKNNVSQYVGNVKERLRNIELTFVREIYMGFGNFGETYMYSFKDNSDNIFTWFTTKRDFNIGEKYTVDFTVKGHKEYKNIKQTNITRATVK